MTPRYLIDSSAFLRIPGSTEVQDSVRPLLDQTAICTPALLECMYAAPAHGYEAALAHVRDALLVIVCDETACDRAVEVQRLLARSGRHRTVKPADLLIAACAETHGLTVLHYDNDFDAIASITGQPTMWIVPHGSIA